MEKETEQHQRYGYLAFSIFGIIFLEIQYILRDDCGYCGMFIKIC